MPVMAQCGTRGRVGQREGDLESRNDVAAMQVQGCADIERARERKGAVSSIRVRGRTRARGSPTHPPTHPGGGGDGGIGPVFSLFVVGPRRAGHPG